MEGQESFSCCSWWSHSNLDLVRANGIPFAYFGLPLAYLVSCSHFPLVQCYSFDYQVRPLSSILFPLVWRIRLKFDFSIIVDCRSTPHIPQVSIPEKLAVDVALSLRYEINRGLAALREIASGRDLKKFLVVCNIFNIEYLYIFLFFVF